MTDNVAAAISRILVVADSEAGRWNAWHAKAIPLAEERYTAYRREAGEEDE